MSFCTAADGMIPGQQRALRMKLSLSERNQSCALPTASWGLNTLNAQAAHCMMLSGQAEVNSLVILLQVNLHPCLEVLAELMPYFMLQVLVAKAESHELFRAAQGVHSLVVLLRSGCHLPLPEQLSAALRSKGSWEDGAEA